MIVKVNGIDTDLPEQTDVNALLARHNLKAENVAVELNKRLVRSARYDTPLKAGDEIEIVTFVGGGA